MSKKRRLKPVVKPFRRRYVLAEGFPWAVGTREYIDVRMNKSNVGVAPEKLLWPDELWRKDVPRFRLVLERI